jgi:hypothetical protein
LILGHAELDVRLDQPPGVAWVCMEARTRTSSPRACSTREGELLDQESLVVYVNNRRCCVKVVAAHEEGRQAGEAPLDEREHVVPGPVRQAAIGDHEIELHLFEQADRLGNVGGDDGERVEARQVRDERLPEEWVVFDDEDAREVCHVPPSFRRFGEMERALPVLEVSPTYGFDEPRAGGSISGIVSVKRVPPSSGAAMLTEPPCASATWRTIARPSPEPGSVRAPAAR